ncbi:MAG: hypothetical protein KBS64_02575 [Treponema sp.]|nr:hypothetical protein [Candidatus Treponema equi]
MSFAQDDQSMNDFDDIFNDAQDITAEENDRINASENSTIDEKGAFSFKFFGKLDSEIGLAFTERIGEIKDGDSRYYVSEYFNFKNDLSFSARKDDTFAMHGTVRSEFFPIDLFNLRELYFDYMAGRYCLVSAGKKIHNWGYVRIFNNEDDYNTDVRITTNIVADSEKCMSGVLSFPFSFVTVTLVALYNPDEEKDHPVDKDNPPKLEDISFAGSMEFLVGQTSINLYGRRSAPSEYNYKKASGTGISNVFGIEGKRSIGNYDFYLQNTCQVGGLEDKLKTNYVTAGFYRLWNDVGLNVEFQDVYDLKDEKTTLRCAIDFGMRRLGPDKDLKLGIQWRHDTGFDKTDYINITDDYNLEKNNYERCKIKIGLVKSNVLPHVDWQNGIEFYYDVNEYPYFYKARLGSIMKLKVKY